MPPTALMDRREFIAHVHAVTLAIGGSTLLAGCSDERNFVGRAASPGFLDVIADLIIPTTSTPGAKAAKVGIFVQRAFQHRLFGADEGTAGELESVLNAKVRDETFIKAAPDKQFKTIADLDRETFRVQAQIAAPPSQAGTFPAAGNITRPEPERNRLWRATKTAVIVGYYMSEIGASQELAYELVPGRYDPDIPYRQGDKYLSNNWIANVG